MTNEEPNAQDKALLRQIRKALDDIEVSLAAGDLDKARYQETLMRKMIDDDRSRPWAHWRPQVEEEFGE
jgi:hypothetical protein